MSKKLHRASTGKADPALYVRLFQNATVDTSHWNKWITTECWIDIIKAKYNVDVSLDLTSVGLNRALGSHPTYKAANIDMVASTNGLGVYRSRYKKKGSSTITGYYITKPNTLPTKPGGNEKWYSDTELVSGIEGVTGQITTRRISAGKRNLPDAPPLHQHQAMGERRRRTGDGCYTTILPPSNDPAPAMGEPVTTDDGSADSDTGNESDDEANLPLSRRLQLETWWDSPEAYRLFKEVAQNPDDTRSLQDIVEERMVRFQMGHTSAQEWKLLVDDFDNQSLCSAFDIHSIQMKCKYLALALKYALEEMPNRTWLQCCRRAIDTINDLQGVKQIKDPNTIRKWHHIFRMHNESFPNPQVRRRGGKVLLPPILDKNPDFRDAVVNYCNDNLEGLCSEGILTFVHEKALPALLEKVRQELDDPEYSQEQLLHDNTLTKLSVPTVYHWLKVLGYKYEVRKKCYYVDNHEKPETKLYRKKWTERYLKYESADV